MKVLFFSKIKILSGVASLCLILACLLVFFLSFTSLVRKVEPHWYLQQMVQYREPIIWETVLNENAVMPGMNDLLIESGYIQWMGFAFLTVCILPIVWILKDYHITNSIRTIMRLPISPTWYYLDKLLPTLFIIAVFWIIQYLTLFEAANYYLGVFPAELRPTDVHATMWDQSPLHLFYRTLDIAWFATVLPFLVMIPASVILSFFAVKSGRRGIFSGIIAAVGFFAAILYLLELPLSIWFTPLMACAVILSGIWHINKIMIT